MELTALQISIIAAIASALAYIIKQFKWTIPRWIVTLILFFISGVLAFGWLGFTLPTLPTFVASAYLVTPFLVVGGYVTWLGEATIALSPFFAFATLIYQTIGKFLFDKIADFALLTEPDKRKVYFTKRYNAATTKANALKAKINRIK